MGNIKYNNTCIDFEYDLSIGTFNISYGNKCSIKDAYSAINNTNLTKINSTSFKEHKLTENIEIKDEFGVGKKLTISNFDNYDFVFNQKFYIYNEGYLLIELEVSSAEKYSTNYMAPLIVSGEENIDIDGDNLKTLFVPFDNDKWVRFISYPVKYACESYDFTAVYDENLQSGLVTGALTHDQWKTGIHVNGEKNKVNFLEVFGGAASEQTRDVLTHGTISGKLVQSPLIFIGYFNSYRKGFEIFGSLNARIKPPLKWKGSVPFGWNSWAALMGSLTFNKYIEASDFLKKNVQHSFNNNSEVYVNFDAFWNSFTPEKIVEALEHVRSNGQKPGIYIAPFITHEGSFEKIVEGTDGKYKYSDLLLKDFENNILPQVDGLYSLDPTHPGTIMKIKYETERFIYLGVDYVKADFLGHAAREGHFYNKDITTGIQAYNFGMKYFTDGLSAEKAGKDIFISLSIAPIFPHGYGHARRISCDAFGTIDQSEYLLNSLTYLWWMNNCLYRYNDPDHIVIYKTYDKVSSTYNEGLTRYNAAVICGTVMLNSDDYYYEAARERAKKIFTNDEVNELARKGETFMPFSGNAGGKAADIFIKAENEQVYVALFNYSISDEKNFCIKLEGLDLESGKMYKIRDLWTKKELTISNTLDIALEPAASTIIKINK